MTPEDMTDKILAIHKDLEEFAKIWDDEYNAGKDESEHSHLHVEVEITVFDGEWCGRISPSALHFPFGTVILKHGVSAKNLVSLLDKMKKESARQLKKAKLGMVDSIPGCGE